MPFANAVVDLVEEMKRTAKGMPTVDSRPALDAFQGEWIETGYWEWAAFDELFRYLRKNRRLKIPPEWYHLVPTSVEVNKNPETEGWYHR